MVSEASWQFGGLSGRGAMPSAEGPMDQQTVETLLRRLVLRVEESERRYSEALDELHTRLDQLAQTADAARLASTQEDTETFGRLHDQVSSLTQRLEREAGTPLDDFERLGRALSGELGHTASAPSAFPGKPDFLSELGASPLRPGEPPASATPFSYSPLDMDYSTPPHAIGVPGEDRDLDKRLVEMAHRLEHSITTALPATALEALNARLDEIGRQLAEVLEQGKRGPALDPIEQKIADMAQQLGRAEAELAKIDGIEAVLHRLIAGVDGNVARLEEVANKAASEAARRVAEEAKQGANTAERLDAMHRDLLTMSERSRASDDRLAVTIEAVHESLKKLVQLMEQSAPPPQAAKPRLPFAERLRRLAPQAPAEEPSAASPAQALEAVPDVAPRNGADLSDSQNAGGAPNFGRAKRGNIEPEEKAFALGKGGHPRARGQTEDANFETPDDLVAAARRAAQAAALKAEERASGARMRRASANSDALSGEEPQSRRSRSLLIISAAVLLAISAALLYSRLGSKQPEIVPPAAEQSAPLSPGGAGAPAQGLEDNTPETAEPNAETPAPPSGSSGLEQEIEASPAGEAVGKASENGNFTDVAKSSHGQAADEAMPHVQPAALKPTEAPSLPPGVVFAIEDPKLGAQAKAAPAPSPLPQSLPLPPPDLGPLPLRQAAAEGDPRAQHAIALRYAQGQGMPQNFIEAARWLERAAAAGLAPAQYRLGAMYERGQGVSKDLGRARSWYQAAAEKGNVKAMHNLAVSLSGRDNGGADYAAASQWYEAAASYGLADSQFNLGILAEYGLGIPKDLPGAYQWFALAAKGGDAEAARRQELVKLQLDPASLAEADKAVAAWTAKEAPQEANEVDEPEEWGDASAANASLVTRAQSLLNKLGYDAGAPDGLMGGRTREAIRSFQRNNGLEETGKITVPLVTKLERLAG
jgi:localization factor PodJL